MTLRFRIAQKQLDSLKLKLKESLDKEKLLPKITQQAKRLRLATQDEQDILNRMNDREHERLKSITPVDRNLRQDNETQRDYLVRTGKITPFMPDQNVIKRYDTEATANTVLPGSMSHMNLHAPIHTATKRKRVISDDEDSWHGDDDNDDEFALDDTTLDSGDEDVLAQKKKYSVKKLDEIYDDDGSEKNYKKRLNDWILNRKIMRYQATHVKNTRTFKKKGHTRAKHVFILLV